MIVMTFDTETTGLPTKRNVSIEEEDCWPHIVQLSWICYDTDNQNLISINDIIIKLPENCSIPKDSSDIHGITDSISREKGIPIKDALLKFIIDYNNANMIVAHNINFDKNMIKVECFRQGYHNIFRDKPIIEYCTMKFGSPITKLKIINPKTNKEKIKFPKLIELYQKLFNEVPNNLHNSLIDVLACFRCFYYMYFQQDIFFKDTEIKNKIEELVM